MTLPQASWKKSSFSGSQTDCIEIAGTLGALRDSKNPNGPVLSGSIRSLAVVVKAGLLDR